MARTDEFPDWIDKEKFFCITGTSDELSIVCVEKNIPEYILSEKDYSCIKIESILSLSSIGIIASISQLFAEAGISIFVISTFSTDYILVKSNDLDKAISIFIEEGHLIRKIEHR